MRPKPHGWFVAAVLCFLFAAGGGAIARTETGLGRWMRGEHRNYRRPGQMANNGAVLQACVGLTGVVLGSVGWKILRTPDDGW